MGLGILLTAAPLGTASPSLSASAASSFSFQNSMSETVLKNYLSRAVTFQGLCGEGGDENMLFDEDLRMILRTGAKFVSRAALFAWTSTSVDQVGKHFLYAEKMAKKVHAADSEIILQAFVAEIVRKSYVDKIAIPDWVFQAFGKEPEKRNFSFDKIIDKKKGADYWGSNAGYPDYSNEETLMWYYYCICKYIDAGYESIHIQEGTDTSEYANVDKLLKMGREYAKTHARRGIVLFHNFFDMTTGGNKIGNRLLFDIQGNGLVPNETVKEDGVLKCRIGSPKDFWCTWFGRSSGGEHPLGFTTDICPTLLEFDNYGQQGALGVSNGESFGTWGYDDITWFAVQPEWYRNEFLLYLDNYMKSNGLTKAGKQAYFCLYPMRRVITAQPNWPETVYKPGKRYSTDFLFAYCESKLENIGVNVQSDGTFQLTSKAYYRANRQSDGCPNGFNQEDTIRQIFLGKNAAENPKYNTVILPAGYQPDGNETPNQTSSQSSSKAAVKPSSVQGNSSLAESAESDTDVSGEASVQIESNALSSNEHSSGAAAINHGKQKSIWPAVWGTVGALAALAGGTVCFLCFRRKQRAKQSDSTKSNKE